MTDTPVYQLIISEREAIDRALRADAMASVLYEFDQWLRAEYKYRENEAAEPIRQQLHDMMIDAGLNVDEL